jgi:hypothetical protein
VAVPMAECCGKTQRGARSRNFRRLRQECSQVRLARGRRRWINSKK